jgi:hypothetical protein
MTIRRIVLSASLALAACGGSSSNGANETCRTFATSSSDSNGGQTSCTVTGGSGGGAMTSDCVTKFDTETLETSTQYSSVDDFVAEAQLGAQRFVQQVQTTTISSFAVANATGFTKSTNTLTAVYTGGQPQSQQSSRVNQLTSGGTSTTTSTTTYTLWDPSNRPTHATITGDGAGDLVISYDDTGRVITTVLTAATSGSVTVISTAYDTSGNETSVTQGANVLRENIGGTTQVCSSPAGN